LSTHDVHAPGNYALLDQVASLRWVADNIESFGGDPANVTLMGHGVGGALVNLLMLSPVTAGWCFRACSFYTLHVFRQICANQPQSTREVVGFRRSDAHLKT
jgi:carboxylesterase type B